MMLPLRLLLYTILQVSTVLGTGISNEVVSDAGIVNRTMDRSLLDVSNEVCEHTWMYFSNDSCHCGDDIHSTVKCSTNPDEISVYNCNCITYDENAGVLVGSCPYGCGFFTMLETKREYYHPLPTNLSKLNKAMCGRLNRDGRLCSKCQEGFSPLAYSYDYSCIKCTNSTYNWLKFISVAFLPLTIFYITVIFFRVDATNPYFYGFITINQALASPTNLRAAFISVGNYKLKFAAKMIALPIAIWNLDFFRTLSLNICLNLSTLEIFILDYAIALYPLALLVITYVLVELHARDWRPIIWLWRPFHKCYVRFGRIINIQSSIVKGFATFLLLSYVKLLNTTLDILLPVKVYNMHKEVVGIYVYYDSSYKYLDKKHLPFAILAVAVLIIFILFPLFLLLLYPFRCFQRCLSFLRLRNHRLHTFVDAFQGHFKDGTELGTRDYRYFSAIYFLGRIVVLFIIFATVEDELCYTLAGMSMLFMGILMLLLQPYKSTRVNVYHAILLLGIALGCFSITINSQASAKDHWVAILAVALVILICITPTLVSIALIVYCIFCGWLKIPWKNCLQRDQNPELDNLISSDFRNN